MTRLFHSECSWTVSCSAHHVLSRFNDTVGTIAPDLRGKRPQSSSGRGSRCRVRGEGKGGVWQVIGRSLVPLDVVWDCLQGLGWVSVHVHVLAKTAQCH